MTNLMDFLNELKSRLTDDCALLIDLEYPPTIESWARDISEAQAEGEGALEIPRDWSKSGQTFTVDVSEVEL